ncbi:MAG: hypothetical protein AB1483_10695 [Candidatus Zixiibacteriota bacterium]
MSLNPLYRFVIDSPLGLETAWQKLVHVTAQKKRMFRFSERVVSQHSEEDVQYVGYLERYKFKLYRPNARFVKMLRLPEYTNMVIKGEMKSGGAGSLINVTIRPPYYQMFFWVFAVLLLITFVVCLIYEAEGVKAWTGLGIYSIVLFGLIAGALEGYVRERLTLEHLFGVVSDDEKEFIEAMAEDDREYLKTIVDEDDWFDHDDDSAPGRPTLNERGFGKK